MTAIKMFKSLGYEYSKERDKNEIIEYFKGVDEDTTIHDILTNCEVIE